jgi:hypothetical protein
MTLPNMRLTGLHSLANKTLKAKSKNEKDDFQRNTSQILKITFSELVFARLARIYLLVSQSYIKT